MVTVLAVIGALVCAFFVISLLIGVFGNKRAVGAKNVRFQLKQNGVDPDILSPRQIESIVLNALPSRNDTEFYKHLSFCVKVVSSHLKHEPQPDDFTQLAQVLLGEKTSDEIFEEMKRNQVNSL